MTFGSLFAGIGGFDLGLERAGMKCAWQVEKDPFCRQVLAKHWPDVPKFEDVCDVGSNELTEVDLICGGFPCQDISHAGRRAGMEGGKSGLWREFLRIVCDLRPRFVLVENSTSLTVRGLARISGDLAQHGYDAEWSCIPAAFVGARHLRARIWILAYPSGERHGTPETTVFSGRIGPEFRGRRPNEPGVGRVADGIPGRVDRVAAIGNAVYPAIPEMIGHAIMSFAAPEGRNESDAPHEGGE